MTFCPPIKLLIAFSLQLPILVIRVGAATASVSISLSQMSRLLIGMDSFVASKCQISANSKVNDEALKRCIGEMKVAQLVQFFDLLNSHNGHPPMERLISRQSSAESTISAHLLDTDQIGHHSFDQRDRQNSSKSLATDQQRVEMTADAFMQLMLKKMLKKLPGRMKQRINVFKKQQKSETIVDELSNLAMKQNVLMLLELFYAVNSLGEAFLRKIATNGRANVEGFGGTQSMIDLEFYEGTNRKLGNIFKTILVYDNENSESGHGKLAFLRSKSGKGKAYFWFNFHKAFSVDIEWQEWAENISEWKWKAQIASTKFGKVLKIIGQFINENCEKHLWNLTEKTDEIENCASRMDFNEFDCVLQEQLHNNGTDNALSLINLIGNFLLCEAMAGASNRSGCPYTENVFAKVQSIDQKIFVLGGLLNFGRLFRHIFGGSPMGISEEIRQVNWRTNISIVFTRNKNRERERSLLGKLIFESGLMETIGSETQRAKSSGNDQRCVLN